jgi:integrase
VLYLKCNLLDMASIQFILNRGLKFDPKKEQPIYLRVTFGRFADFTASLRYKVLPDDWNSDEQQVRSRAHIKDSALINAKISKWDKIYTDYALKCEIEDVIPTTNDLKELFVQNGAKQNEKKETMTLMRYFDAFMETAHLRANGKRNTKVSKGTVKGYRTSINILKAFIEKTKRRTDFDTINLSFYHDFIDYCETQNYTRNYIGKHIKTLKLIMSEAVDLGYTTNVQYRDRRFSVLTEEVDEVYLDEAELKKIWSIDLKEFPRHERARDLFLIGCYTGLRVSDYNYLNASNIKNVKGVDMITIKTQKMDEKVSIPISPLVKQIFAKNNGLPPKRLPDQHINQLIKDVCEWVGIDDRVALSRTKGGMKVTASKHKFEAVKTHTARRTFCSNMYLNGIEATDIMRLSGHKTYESFMTYLKIDSEETAIRLSGSSYLNNNLSVA